MALCFPIINSIGLESQLKESFFHQWAFRSGIHGIMFPHHQQHWTGKSAGVVGQSNLIIQKMGDPAY